MYSRSMRFSMGIAAVLVMVIVSPAYAQSYVTQCAEALRPDTIQLKSNKYAQSSLLQTLSTSNAVQKHQDGTFDVPGYFSGSYSSSEDARSSLSSYLNTSWTSDDYLGYVAAYVPKAAYQGYSDCLKSVFGREGMNIEILSADEKSSTVALHFHGPDGVEARYTALVTSDGLAVTPVKRHWRASGDSQVIRIVKVDPAQSLHITANIVAGPTTPNGDHVSIPPFIHTVRNVSKVSSSVVDPQAISCGGNNDYHSSSSGSYGPPILAASSDDFYDANPQVGMVTSTSWNGPGPVDPRYAFDTVSNKIIRLHTVCTVGSGLGDNRFFVQSQVSYVLNHFEYQTISPVPSGKPLKDVSITSAK